MRVLSHVEAVEGRDVSGMGAAIGGDAEHSGGGIATVGAGGVCDTDADGDAQCSGQAVGDPSLPPIRRAVPPVVDDVSARFHATIAWRLRNSPERSDRRPARASRRYRSANTTEPLHLLASLNEAC